MSEDPTIENDPIKYDLKVSVTLRFTSIKIAQKTGRAARAITNLNLADSTPLGPSIRWGRSQPESGTPIAPVDP